MSARQLQTSLQLEQKKNEKAIETMTNLLFCGGSANNFLVVGGHLREFAYVLLAVVLMHLQDFEAAFDSKAARHIVTAAIYNAAEAAGVSQNTLYEWGDAIYSDWINGVDRIMGIGDSRNILETVNKSISKMSDCYATMNEVNTKVGRLQQKVKSQDEETKAALTSLSRKMDFCLAEIQKVNTNVVNFMKSFQASSGTTVSIARETSASTSSTRAISASSIPLSSSTSKPRKETSKETSDMNQFMMVNAKRDELIKAEQKSVFSTQPNEMAAESFSSNIYFYGIDLTRENPFKFKGVPAKKKNKLLLGHTALIKTLTAQEKGQLSNLKKQVKGKEYEDREQVRKNVTSGQDIIRPAVYRLLERIEEDQKNIKIALGKKPPKKVKREAMTTAGSIVSNIETIKANRKHLDEKRVTFYLDGTVAKAGKFINF